MSHVDNQTRRAVRRTALMAVVVIFVVVVAFFWKVTQPRALRASDMALNGLVLFDQPREVGSFELMDHQGQAFTREDLNGKWTMLFPGFTYCPDICPTTMAQLGQMWQFLDEKPKQDLQVLMLSIDPGRDTVEKLGLYVPYFGSDFVGLTGELDTISGLTRQLNIAFENVEIKQKPEEYNVIHSSNIVLLDPKGNYRGFFKPPFDPALLKLNYQSVWVQN